LCSHPEIRIWVRTAAPPTSLVAEALVAGAAGVIPQSGDTSALLDKIR